MKKAGIMVIALSMGVAAWAQQAAEMEAMMQLFGGMAQTQQDATPAATIAPRALRDALPGDFAGFERVEAGSERQGAFGITTVVATGVYEQGDQTIRIEITDMSGMGGLGALAMMGMAQAEVDKETRHGFERTTTSQGFKGKETYNRTDRQGDIEIVAGSRVSVKVNGSGLESFDVLTQAVAAMDLKALSELQPEAAE